MISDQSSLIFFNHKLLQHCTDYTDHSRSINYTYIVRTVCTKYENNAVCKIINVSTLF